MSIQASNQEMSADEDRTGYIVDGLSLLRGLAAGVLIALGAQKEGILVALAATARLAFLLFWPAYSAGALVSLFGPTFQPLKQRAREFGLAFASAQLVHLGLVVWLCLIGAAPGVSTFILFGTAAVWVYVLALFSINPLHQALGPKYWRLLSIVGMNYIAYAFAVDFLKKPPSRRCLASSKVLAFYRPCLRRSGSASRRVDPACLA